MNDDGNPDARVSINWFDALHDIPRHGLCTAAYWSVRDFGKPSQGPRRVWLKPQESWAMCDRESREAFVGNVTVIVA
jgi:hypothetical protein